MAIKRRWIGRLWTIVLVGLAFLMLALAGERLYSRPLLSMLVRALHEGSLPHVMWMPARGPGGERMMVKRMRPDLAVASSTAPSPIEFLGAESYLAGVDAPYWAFPNPVNFLGRQSNCTLTAYTDSLTELTISPVQTNYQDILHAQGQLTTAGDRPIGCADSRLGVPSNYAIIEKTGAGAYYFASATTYGLFASNTAITVGLFNDDNTTVVSTTPYEVPGTPSTLTSVDLNGDGKPDLVVVSNDPDTGVATVSVFPGNGDGTYGTRTDYVTQLIAGGVTVADVNKDNHPDLIVAGQPSSLAITDPAVQIFLNNGTGLFGPAINGPALPDKTASNAAVADFNRDGNPDIATNDGYILLGDGKGDFTLKSGLQFLAADNLIAADLNNDSKIDLATVTFFSNQTYKNTVGIFLGNGDGTFTPGQRYSSIFGGGNIGVSDLDDDGNPDIIVGFADPYIFGSDHGAASYSYFLMGRGDGTFAGATSNLALGIPDDVGPAFAVADLNGDNKPDIVTTNSGTSGLELYTLTGNGDGTFAPGASKAITAANASTSNPVLALAADLNSDKNVDAIIGITSQSAAQTGTALGDLAVFLGNGNDTFGSEIDSTFDSTAGAMIAGDFNNDKVLDVIAGGVVTTDASSNPATGAIFYLEGENNGMFDPPVQIGSPLNPVSFAVEDLNGDKNLDLVVADSGTPFATTPVAGSVLVYLGNGNGTFQSPKTLNAPEFPQAVAIADVNNDGNPDIVVLSTPSASSGQFVSTVWVFMGDGKGNFGDGMATTLDEEAQGLQVADLNGDGLPDLAISSCCGFANSEVWSGNGNGTFNGPTELPIGISSSFPILADINGDKKLDLLFSTGTSIQALLNVSGEGVPTPLPPGAIGATPTATATVKKSATPTATATHSATPTASSSGSRTATPTASRSATPTATATGATATATSTASPTPSPSPTPPGVITINPSSLDFGDKTTVGKTSNSKSVTIKNSGNKKTGTAVTIEMEGASPSVFSVKSECQKTLAPGKSCKVSVTFKPTDTTERNGSLMISDNVTGSPQSVSLSGMGKAAKNK